MDAALWEALAENAPAGRTAPHIPGRRFSEVVDIEDDEPNRLEALDGLDLEGIVLGIVYRDSQGTETQRRVAMYALKVSDANALFITAYCHERKACRSFRYDRIISVIDIATGELFERDAFFASELGISVPAQASEVHDTAPPLLTTVRRLCRDEMIVLAGLSRSDGLMRPEEVDAIVDHAQRVGADSDLWLEAEHLDALRRYIRNMRPDSATLLKSALKASLLPGHRRRDLLRACRKVMDADGVQNPAEVAYILRLQSALEQEALSVTSDGR